MIRALAAGAVLGAAMSVFGCFAFMRGWLGIDFMVETLHHF